MKTFRYKVAEANDIEQFENDVTNLLHAGFVLVGGVCVTSFEYEIQHQGTHIGYRYSQAMVLEWKARNDG